MTDPRCLAENPVRELTLCALPKGHAGAHRSGDITWTFLPRCWAELTDAMGTRRCQLVQDHAGKHKDDHGVAWHSARGAYPDQVYGALLELTPLTLHQHIEYMHPGYIDCRLGGDVAYGFDNWTNPAETWACHIKDDAEEGQGSNPYKVFDMQAKANEPDPYVVAREILELLRWPYSWRAATPRPQWPVP